MLVVIQLLVNLFYKIQWNLKNNCSWVISIKTDGAIPITSKMIVDVDQHVMLIT